MSLVKLVGECGAVVKGYIYIYVYIRWLSTYMLLMGRATTCGCPPKPRNNAFDCGRRRSLPKLVKTHGPHLGAHPTFVEQNRFESLRVASEALRSDRGNIFLYFYQWMSQKFHRSFMEASGDFFLTSRGDLPIRSPRDIISNSDNRVV